MNLARIRKSKAFTLIELIVVIVIIGILVAALAFAYTRFIDGTRQEAAESIANQVGKTVQAESALTQATISATVAVDTDAVTAGTQNVWAADLAGSNATVTVTSATAPVVLTIAKDGKDATVTFSQDASGSKYTVAP